MPKKKLTAADRRSLKHQNKMLLKKWLKKNKPRIIGLDISTTSTGIYYNGMSKLLKPKGNEHRLNRIEFMRKTLLYLITVMNFNEKPNIAFVEDYSYSLGATSLAQVAEASGVLKNVLYYSDMLIFSVSPLTLKKFVMGPGGVKEATGSRTKSLMLVEVLDRWGIKFNNDDECDAFCLYKFGESFFDYIKGKEFKKWEIEMFDKFLTDRGDVTRL